MCDTVDCNIAKNAIEKIDVNDVFDQAVKKVEPKLANVCETMDCNKTLKNALKAVEPQLKNVCSTVDCDTIVKNAVQRSRWATS